MIKVRFLCSQCHSISIYDPAVKSEYDVECLTCVACNSYVGDFIHTPDKEATQ